MDIATTNSKGEWTLTSLYAASLDDLKHCHTELEKTICNTVNSKEMRNLWSAIVKTRKPTPGEVSVAEHLGII